MHKLMMFLMVHLYTISCPEMYLDLNLFLHGRTFDGTSPTLIVMDPEWLKEAFIKHFPVFTNRRRVNFGGSIGSSLFGVEGEHWKHNRKLLSAEFSSGKLKKVCMDTIAKA